MRKKLPNDVMLFYAGQQIELDPFQSVHQQVSDEIYQGGYIYQPLDQRWYRCDFTPVLIEDVPKELRLIVLLLT